MVICYEITTNSAVHSRQNSRVMNEVGFRIPRVGFRIPGTGFRIPKPWIPDSKGKKMLNSGFRIPLLGADTVYRVISPKP